MELSSRKSSIAANYHELGNRFHSFTAKTHIDTFIKLISCLISAFSFEFLSKLKSKFRIVMFPRLYHFYGTICAAKVKELLRNSCYESML